MNSHLRTVLLVLSLTLPVTTACSRAAPSADAPDTGQGPIESPEAQVDAPAVSPTPQAYPIDAVRESLMVQVADPERMQATLIQLMSVRVAGGESVVFQFETELNGILLKCSGHAVARLDGTVYSVSDEYAALACGSPQPGTSITAHQGLGIDLNGNEVGVVFGEIYSADVVAIRAFFDGGESVATISGGGYYAAVPVGAANVRAHAYDGSGMLLHEQALAQE